MQTARLKWAKVLLLLVEVAAVLALSACAPASARALHLSSACPNSRSVALTFDDGPNPPYTEQILSILASRQVRATFFDEGEAAEAHPETVRAEVAATMAVGAHSWSHSDRLPWFSAEDFASDTSMASASISRAAGYVPALYRAPYGHTSAIMLRELRKLGYVSIGWDVDARDWSDATVDEIVRNVLSNAHPGAIVLMHDGGLGGGNPDRSKTIDALPRIIDGLRREGYALVTVPDATGLSLAQPAPRTEGLWCSGN